jgi:K-box region
MRGEELDGLSVEDLQKLEKNLESGLSRVLDRKVLSIDIFFFKSKHQL